MIKQKPEVPSLSLSRIGGQLSLHFNGHFPGGPGLAGTRMSPFWILLELRMMEVVVITGAIRRSKIQSECHHQQTNIHFYRPDALPVTQPAVQSTEGTPENKIDAYVIT